VQDQSARVEAEQQILCATTGRLNAPACGLIGDVGAYAPSQARLMNRERDDLAADDMRFDAATGSLDFR